MLEPKKVGKNIARLRKEQKMTQKELAAKLNVIDKTISRWECGYGLPDITTFPVIAKVFGVSIEELIGEECAEPSLPVAAAEETAPDAKKKRNLPGLFAISAAIVLLLAGIMLAVFLPLGKNMNRINSYCWDVALQSNADCVLITAFGNEEVMSMELKGGNKGKFVCQETWQESPDARYLNCSIKGSYTIEDNSVYFYPTKVIDPDGTEKLRTHKMLGIEKFSATVEYGADGLLSAVVFLDDTKNAETSVFGRWTKFCNFFSRTEGEVYFERVQDGSFTYPQQTRLPVFALQAMGVNVPVGLEIGLPKYTYYVGEVIEQKDVGAWLVYVDGSKKDVSAEVRTEIAGRVLGTADREVAVGWTDGVIEKSATVPIEVKFGHAWVKAEQSKANYTFFTHYNNHLLLAFGVMEMFGDATGGTFFYRENYGKDVFTSAAVISGSYTVEGDFVAFHAETVTSSKNSARFVPNGEGEFYLGRTNETFSELSFRSSATDKNFFGYYAEENTSTSFSREEGEIYFERVYDNSLSERAQKSVETYKGMIRE